MCIPTCKKAERKIIQLQCFSSKVLNVSPEKKNNVGENIESIFQSADVPTNLDLLSIDIDYNDYYIWKAITAYNPRVVIIEYNSILLDIIFY